MNDIKVKIIGIDVKFVLNKRHEIDFERFGFCSRKMVSKMGTIFYFNYNRKAGHFTEIFSNKQIESRAQLYVVNLAPL